MLFITETSNAVRNNYVIIMITWMNEVIMDVHTIFLVHQAEEVSIKKGLDTKMLLNHQEKLRSVVKLNSLFIIHTFFKYVGPIRIKGQEKLDNFFHPYQSVACTCTDDIWLSFLRSTEGVLIVIDQS